MDGCWNTSLSRFLLGQMAYFQGRPVFKNLLVWSSVPWKETHLKPTANHIGSPWKLQDNLQQKHQLPHCIEDYWRCIEPAVLKSCIEHIERKIKTEAVSYPDHPRMVYLPTFPIQINQTKWIVNIPYMDPMGTSYQEAVVLNTSSK